MRGAAVHWSVWSGLSPEHERSLLDREVDLIVAGDVGEEIEGLVRHHVLTEPFFLAVPRSYQGPTDDLGELARRLDLVRYSQQASAPTRIVVLAGRRWFAQATTRPTAPWSVPAWAGR